MKRLIQKVKNIKLGRSQRLVEAAGATVLIFVLTILFHPLLHLAYYGLCLMMILNIWGRAWEDYQYA